MPELLILLLGLVAAGVLVLRPLSGRVSEATGDDELDAATLRHRVALEALRDVETDRHAGSLDGAAYADQLAAAEERAATTRAALDAQRPRARTTPSGGRRAGVALAGLIAAVLLGGSVLPATGMGNRTVVNQALAAGERAEMERQQQIGTLLDALEADPRDTEILSQLADAYLAGRTQDDLVRGAVALRLLIEFDPDRNDAYERIMGAYLRAGDYPNARAAHDAYRAVAAPDPLEVAFFDGIIALGESRPDAAIEAFDRFLDLAPDDPRAAMIRSLRNEVESPAP